MFTKILVPLDGSSLAERALAPALTLSQQAEGQLLLMRVAIAAEILMPDPHIFGGYSLLWPDQALDRAEHEAKEYFKHLLLGPLAQPVRAETRVVEGEVADSIVRTAAEEHCDLIVMSSHGYSGLTRWLLGSVAERVLALAPCPVLIIRAPHEIRQIVIPLDGSPLSETALVPGLAAAACLNAEVTLLRAVPRASAAEIERLEEVERGLGRQLQQDLIDQAETYLRGLIDQHAASGLTFHTAVTFEPAANSILNYTETHESDLVVMSTHGRTGLQHWVYGSVTEKVLRGGPQNLLIVRPRAG